MGYLSDHIARRVALLLSYALLAGGTLLLFLVRNQTGLLAMAVLAGLGYGGSLVMMTLSAAEAFGVRAIGKILGVILVFLTVGGSLGPIVVGYMTDHFGDYRRAFMVVMVAAASAFFCGLGVRPQLPRNSQAGAAAKPKE
jgi:MFS family permease